MRRFGPLAGSLLTALLLVAAMALSTVLATLWASFVLDMPLARSGEPAFLGFLRRHLLVLSAPQWVLLGLGAIPLARATGLDRRALGLNRAGLPPRDLGRGLLVGGAMILLPALLGLALGAYAVDPSAGREPTGVAALGRVALLLLPLALAAWGEEVLCRGLLLRLWEDTLGPRGAILLSTLVFTALHLGNPDLPPMGALGVFLAGIWLGFAALATGSLGLAVGLHLGWNLATGMLLGLPVSGYPLPSLLRFVPAEEAPVALVGGPFGPEAGLLFHLSLAAGTVWVLLRGRRPLNRPEPSSPAPG